MKHFLTSLVVTLSVSLSVLLSGCETTPVQSGALGGGAIGAIAGQLIGRDTKSTLIGAGAGALLGGIANDARVRNNQKQYQQGYNDARTQQEWQQFQQWKAQQNGYPPPPPVPNQQSYPQYNSYSQPQYNSYGGYRSYNTGDIIQRSNNVLFQQQQYNTPYAKYNTSIRSSGYDYSGISGEQYMRRTVDGDYVAKGSINGNYHPGVDLSNYVSPNIPKYKHLVNK